MLRRVVSNPLFYLVLLGGCIALFISARSANGQSRMGVWTAQKQVAPTIYQPKSSVDDSVVGVTMLHLELTQRSAGSDISFVQAVDVLEKSDAILANNVIGYLQNANNKRLALDTYTKNVEKTVSEGQQVLTNLQSEREIASQTFQDCSSEKSAADNQFFQGLIDADGAMMQQGYDGSLQAGGCEATSRISVNAYQAVITRVEGYTTALAQMNTLLVDNEEEIVANVDLFRDNYLERLLQIRDQLGTYNNGAAID